jgi:hypothetical protein
MGQVCLRLVRVVPIAVHFIIEVGSATELDDLTLFLLLLALLLLKLVLLAELVFDLLELLSL